MNNRTFSPKMNGGFGIPITPFSPNAFNFKPYNLKDLSVITVDQMNMSLKDGGSPVYT